MLAGFGEARCDLYHHPLSTPCLIGNKVAIAQIESKPLGLLNVNVKKGRSALC
jgi:hypothetical protein